MKGSLPHILLIVTDQFRYDAVSPIITPNLHSFEQTNGSTTFHRAYTSTPTCTPARAALLTGKSPWAHGLLGYAPYTNCTQYPTTLPRVLRDQAGYRTITVGKNHFGPIKHIHGYQNETLYEGLSYMDDYNEWFNERMPNMDPTATCHLDWNDWPACPYSFDEYMHPTAWTTRKALSTLEDYFDDDNNQTAPLLLKVSYHRPHSPYDPPRRIFNQYLKGGNKSHVPQLERFANKSSWDRRYKHFRMKRSAWAGDPGVQAARHTRAGYLASVEYVDENIGQLFDYLHSKDLWDDFFIVWASDHGDQNGDHYLWRKGYPWESNARVRVVMNPHQSSRSPPRQSQAIVELRDIAPTLYDVTGVLQDVQAQDPLMDGESLLPILTGQQSLVREWVDLEHAMVYIRTIQWNALIGYLEYGHEKQCDLWKYIFNGYDASEQLFCLVNDPNETYDLAPLPEYSYILSTWRERLVVQFNKEGRGQDWVHDNQLQSRYDKILYGDNFPCKEDVAVSRHSKTKDRGFFDYNKYSYDAYHRPWSVRR